jgi:hypothetical protein
MWRDSRAANGKKSGLHSYYYILNNLIRNTINPKDGAASDINGYMRNVLARFAPRGDKFNVPQFIWHELRLAIEDGRKGLPYAPYLMFVIKRVIGLQFLKDGMHIVYKIQKTQPVAASQATGGGSYAHDDILESSRSRSRKSNKMKKFAKWLKAIFGQCTYVAEHAYETQMEQREQRGEHHHHLLHHHLLHSTIFPVSQTQIQMMMMRRRSNRDMPLIGRILLSTRRDRDRDVPPASPPPLTDKVVIVLTLTTMTMVVLGLLQEVARLLGVMALIGKTCKEMMSRC